MEPIQPPKYSSSISNPPQQAEDKGDTKDIEKEKQKNKPPQPKKAATP
jgi:hypothetical protein